MKKIVLTAVILILAIGLVVSGCTEPAAEPTTPAPAPTTPEPATPAPAKTTVIKFASHRPPTMPDCVFFENEWGPKMEELTNGQLKFEYYWGGVLGKGPEALDMVTSKAAEMAFITPTYYPAELPMTLSIQVPGFYPCSQGDKCYCVVREMFDKYLYTEWEDVKPLFLCISVEQPTAIQTTEKPIRTLDDLQGMQIGAPGSGDVEMLELLGATPVQVTPTEAYIALERGMIEGYSFPLTGFLNFGYYEVTKYHTNFNVLGCIDSIFAMNLDTWNKLPADVKKVLEDNKRWTEDQLMAIERNNSVTATKAYQEAGIEFISLSPEDEAKMSERLRPMVDSWLAKMDELGLPGQEMWDEAQRLVAAEKCK